MDQKCIFEDIEGEPKSHIREVWSHVIINFGEKTVYQNRNGMHMPSLDYLLHILFWSKNYTPVYYESILMIPLYHVRYWPWGLFGYIRCIVSVSPRGQSLTLLVVVKVIEKVKYPNKLNLWRLTMEIRWNNLSSHLLIV